MKRLRSGVLSLTNNTPHEVRVGWLLCTAEKIVEVCGARFILTF